MKGNLNTRNHKTIVFRSSTFNTTYSSAAWAFTTGKFRSLWNVSNEFCVCVCEAMMIRVRLITVKRPFLQRYMTILESV